MIKDLFLDVTHKQAGIVGPKSTPHSSPSGLAVLILSIERESSQCENQLCEANKSVYRLVGDIHLSMVKTASRKCK